MSIMAIDPYRDLAPHELVSGLKFLQKSTITGHAVAPLGASYVQ